MRACLISLTLSLVGAAAPALAAASGDEAVQGTKVCLRAVNVLNHVVPDDRTIIFHMKDGTVWKNTLQADCHGLHMADSFTLAPPQGWLCANQQPLRINGAAPITCYLGDFQQMPAAK